jgi:F-type H+-transporting ATPase subunit a
MTRLKLITFGSMCLATAMASGIASAAPDRETNWLARLATVQVAHHTLFGTPARMALAWAFLVMLFVVVFSAMATRRLSLRPSRTQVVLETLVSALRGMTIDAIGPRGPEFLPFIGTLFIYIAVMNLTGLIPGFLSPTSSLSITDALAIIVFVVVQFYGVKEHGFGYLAHFIEGVPRSIWYLPVGILVFVVHLVGEVTRPVTLAIRLFGNIMAGDTILLVLTGLAIPLLLRFRLPVPLQLPNLLLEVLLSVVQAFVFCMLTSVYLLGVVGESEESEAHAG